VVGNTTDVRAIFGALALFVKDLIQIKNRKVVKRLNAFTFTESLHREI